MDLSGREQRSRRNQSIGERLLDLQTRHCEMSFTMHLDCLALWNTWIGSTSCVLVQFWVVVDGFRNPLEQDTDEPVDQLGSLPDWTDSDRADLAQINEGYLSRPELKILPQAHQAVITFLKAGRLATPQQYYNARRHVLQAQTAVYDDLQEPHFRRFKKSDLYYKWLAMDEAANTPATTRTIAQTLDDSTAEAPLMMSRTHSAPRATLQPPDLRRAVASSSDLKSQTKLKDVNTAPRRSLDGNPTTRAPLFEDGYESDPMANSIASLNSDADHIRPNGNDAQIVDAMQAALTDIMGDEPEASLFHEPSLSSPLENDSMKSSLEIQRTSSPNPLMKQKKRKGEA